MGVMLGIDLKLNETVFYAGDEISLEILLSNLEGLK